jgi:hypothetical protein
MATITASPDAVGFYATGGQASTIVDWNTGASFPGIVFVAIGGLIEKKLAGQQAAGARRGSLPLRVTYPNFYYLSLKRADNLIEIAHTVVTTFDLRQQLAEDFAAAYLPQLRPQMITHLVVKPGVDTVRISFRTTRPTIPTTELRDDNGKWVDGRLPLFGGLQTVHEAKFGIEKPLALDTKHTFKIEAFGATGKKNSPNKAVVTGEFMTGTRTVDVMFETLNVHDDGDPGPRGKGEFMFSFGAGEAETGALMGEPAFWPDTGKVDISDDDPPADLDKKISLASAPGRLWLQVIGKEHDRTIMPWETGLGLGIRPVFEGSGSSYHGLEAAQQADVTTILNLGSTPGRRMIPFEMKTDDFPVDFVVTGHVAVNAFVGSTISPKIVKSVPFNRSSAYLTEPGGASRLAVAGISERSELVALGADGALYHRSLAPELPAQSDGGGWTRIELPGRGTPVVVLSVPGMLDVIDLNDDGSVIHCGYDLQKSKGGKWRRLGGRFREIHPAVSIGKARAAGSNVTLFGVADDGGVHVRDAYSEDQSWDRLGDQPVRAIAPVCATGAGTSLFAVGDDGTLVHYSQRNGRWRAEAIGGRVPGEIPTQLLTAVVIDQVEGEDLKSMRRDLVIGAMSEDHRVRILRWPAYPTGAPEKRWKELGSVQDLLGEEATGAAANTRARAAPGGAQRSRVE